MITITTPPLGSYRVTKKLTRILTDTLAAHDLTPGEPVTLNFRSSDYNPVTGGYQPVEVRLHADGSLDYITEFMFDGCDEYADLGKQLDFDFSGYAFGQGFMGQLRYTIAEHGKGLFRTWQANFCHYYAQGVYDQISVTNN